MTKDDLEETRNKLERVSQSLKKKKYMNKINPKIGETLRGKTIDDVMVTSEFGNITEMQVNEDTEVCGWNKNILIGFVDGTVLKIWSSELGGMKFIERELIE